MKTPTVLLALLVCALATPGPQAEDAEFIDGDIPLTGGGGGGGSKGDAAGDDGGFFFGFPSFFSRRPQPQDPGSYDESDAAGGDGGFFSILPFFNFPRPSFSSPGIPGSGDCNDTNVAVSSYDNPFHDLFEILDLGISSATGGHDFENTTQEEEVVGGTRMICNETIKTTHRGGYKSTVFSKICFLPENTETDQEGTVDTEAVLPEVNPEAETPNIETNEIPRGVSEEHHEAQEVPTFTQVGLKKQIKKYKRKMTTQRMQFREKRQTPTQQLTVITLV